MKFSSSLSPPFLFVLSAPTATGKTTFCSKLIQDYQQKLVLSVSVTTRMKRPQEEEGKHYFFISQESFEEKVQNAEFAEWAKVHGFYYGTLRNTLDEAFQQGRSVLLPIDVQGAFQLKKSYPEKCVLFFLLPPHLKVLEERLRLRGVDTPDSLKTRLDNAQKELLQAPHFDHQIINDNLEIAYGEMCHILQNRYGL